MNRGQLRELASIWLDDRNNGYFLVADVNTWLNNAQREVQKLLLNAGEDYYTQCVETTLVIGQKKYELPSDFLKVMRMAWVSSGTGDTATEELVRPITRNEQELLYEFTSGDPYYYFFNRDSFSLIPVPNLPRTLRLYYAYRVADMVNDSDEPDVPEDYHEYIAIMAARDGFLRDGRDMTPINIKLGYFEKMMKENAEQRNQDFPRSIVSTPDGFGAM